MSDADREHATSLTRHLADGDRAAAEALFPRVYDELRAMAEARLLHEKTGHTLQATALVNEAFLKLVDGDKLDWRSTTHFKAIAARAMGQVLIDHARIRDAAKRGGGWHRVVLEEAATQLQVEAPDVDDVADAIDRLGAEEERVQRGVMLRFYGGLGSRDVAEVLGVSLSTVEADWRIGRAWLRRELGGSAEA